MVTEPSSRDLHPKTGARFVFDRLSSEAEPVYAVVIHLPAARRWAGTLRWANGHAQLVANADQPALDADDVQRWATAEALKLARVLHRDPKPHMLRWRG